MDGVLQDFGLESENAEVLSFNVVEDRNSMEILFGVPAQCPASLLI